MDLAKLALDDEWLRQLDDVARAAKLDLPPKRLAGEVRALSEAYNTGAFERARTRGGLAARLLFSFPRDVPKMACAARELVWSGRLALDGTLRVLDVGAGLGASTWGLARLLALGGARGAIEATFVDQDAEALVLARAIAGVRKREGAIDVRVTTERVARSSSSSSSDKRYDAILVGQSLGEIDSGDDAQTTVLAELAERHLAEHGSLVVVEPALSARTRRLQRVRDALVARGLTVFAPCLHAAPCPMLANEKSWCHEDLAVDLPPQVASLARASGLRWQGLTFSYLVLRKDGFTLGRALGDAGRGAMRVVSQPIVTKGKRELYLCGARPEDPNDARIRRLARLDRDEKRGDRSRDRAEPGWSGAARGDVLAFAPPLDEDATRVPANVATCVLPTS